MSNSTLNTLLKEYETKKYIADLNFEKEKNSFYNSHPELAKINSELGALALDISKAVLNNDIDLSNKLREKFNSLKIKKENLMKSIKIPAGVLNPIYECSVCKDTGFIQEKNGKTSLCNCIKQKLFDLDFNKSNIRKS